MFSSFTASLRNVGCKIGTLFQRKKVENECEATEEKESKELTKSKEELSSKFYVNTNDTAKNEKSLEDEIKEVAANIRDNVCREVHVAKEDISNKSLNTEKKIEEQVEKYVIKTKKDLDSSIEIANKKVNETTGLINDNIKQNKEVVDEQIKKLSKDIKNKYKGLEENINKETQKGVTNVYIAKHTLEIGLKDVQKDINTNTNILKHKAEEGIKNIGGEIRDMKNTAKDVTKQKVESVGKILVDQKELVLDSTKKVGNRLESETNKCINENVHKGLETLGALKKDSALITDNITSNIEKLNESKDNITQKISTTEDSIFAVKKSLDDNITNIREEIKSTFDSTKQFINQSVVSEKQNISSVQNNSDEGISQKSGDLKHYNLENDKENVESNVSNLDKSFKNISCHLKEEADGVLSSNLYQINETGKENILNLQKHVSEEITQKSNDLKNSLGNEKDNLASNMSCQLEEAKNQSIQSSKEEFAEGIQTLKNNVQSTVNKAMENVKEDSKMLKEKTNDFSNNLYQSLDTGYQDILNMQQNISEGLAQKSKEIKDNLEKNVASNSSSFENSLVNLGSKDQLKDTKEHILIKTEEIGEGFSILKDNLESSLNKALEKTQDNLKTHESKIKKDAQEGSDLLSSRSENIQKKITDFKQTAFDNLHQKIDVVKSVDEISSTVAEPNNLDFNILSDKNKIIEKCKQLQENLGDACTSLGNLKGRTENKIKNTYDLTAPFKNVKDMHISSNTNAADIVVTNEIETLESEEKKIKKNTLDDLNIFQNRANQNISVKVDQMEGIVNSAEDKRKQNFKRVNKFVEEASKKADDAIHSGVEDIKVLVSSISSASKFSPSVKEEVSDTKNDIDDIANEFADSMLSKGRSLTKH